MHAIICVVLSVITMTVLCGHGHTPFNNEQCLDTPRYLHIWALVNTCGYFTVDTMNICFAIGTFNTYDKQMIGHHVVAFLTFIGTLVFMNWTVVFGVMLLFVEVSTTYISIRWLLYTHKQHRTVCNTINAFIIFLTFLFGRLVFQIGILCAIAYPKLFEMFADEHLQWWEVLICIFMFMAITVSALLNCFWMYLIVA